MRAALEAAIRARIQQVAPQLVGDLRGRERVTVLITRLEVPLASGILNGEAEAALFADTPDAFEITALVRAFDDPIQFPSFPRPKRPSAAAPGSPASRSASRR